MGIRIPANLHYVLQNHYLEGIKCTFLLHSAYRYYGTFSWLQIHHAGVNRILLFLGMAIHTNSFFKGTVWRENYGIPSCAALRLNKNLTGVQFCDQRTIICHNLLFGNTHAIWHPSVQSSLFRHNYIF